MVNTEAITPSVEQLKQRIDTLVGSDGRANFCVRSLEETPQRKIIDIYSKEGKAGVAMRDAIPLIHPSGYELFPYYGLEIDKRVLPISGIKRRSTEGVLVEWEEATPPSREKTREKTTTPAERRSFMDVKREFSLSPDEYLRYLDFVTIQDRLDKYDMTELDRYQESSALGAYRDVTRKLMRRALQGRRVQYVQDPVGFITLPFILPMDVSNAKGVQFSIKIASRNMPSHLSYPDVYLHEQQADKEFLVATYRVRKDNRLGITLAGKTYDRPMSVDKVRAFTQRLSQII